MGARSYYVGLEDGRGDAGYGAATLRHGLGKRFQEGGTVLTGTKTPFLVAFRRSLNALAILLSLFIPWLIGLVVCWALSSKVHYYQPWLTWGIVALVASIILYFFLRALEAIWEKTRRGLHVPSWYIFVFLTSLFLFISGCYLGNYIYKTCTKPNLMLLDLTTYSDIDTSRMSGAQMMDVGLIHFTEDTQLDLTRTMGFKDRDMYCVAPIVTGVFTQGTYDFWAIGKNCCSPPPLPGLGRSYHCGAFNQPNITSAIRLLEDRDRPFYRLAVQQAEARYSINARHPLFFTWGGPEDLGFDGSDNGNNVCGRGGLGGNRLFETGAFGSFFLQLFLVLTASIAFTTLGQPM